MQTALYGKIKEKRERETGVEWLIGANTQYIPYLSIVATQHKTRQRRPRHLLMRVKACKARKCVLMMGKTRKREGAQAHKARVKDG